MSLRTVITGGRLVTDDGDIRADLVIDDHEIVALLATAEGVDADQTIDATDLLLLPGGVDMRIEAPWLSQNGQADTALGVQQAAAAGGITSFAANPGTPESESGAHASLATDVAMWHPIDGESLPTAVQISRMIGTGVAGFTANLRGNGGTLTDRQLYDLMKLMGSFSVPLAIQPLHPAMDTRDPMSERLAVSTALLFAEETGAWVHFNYVTTAGAMRQVVDARARGARVTASVSALHLALDSGDMNRHIRTTTPLRSRDEIEALWEYVLDESVDAIGSTPVRRASAKTPAMPDAQSSLSLFWDEAVSKRKMSHAQAARMLSTNPAHILGLHPKKGTLRIGGDADLVLFDPEGTWTARDRDMVDGGHWTPLDGRELTGFVVRTIRRGETVYDAERHSEQLVSAGSGQLLTRADVVGS